jgi:signal transduction histidine kinase
MKKNYDKYKHRFSLMLSFSAFVLMILVITAVAVGVIVFFLINRDTLRVGENALDAWTLFRDMVLISMGIGTVFTFVSLRFPIKTVNKILNAMNRLASGDYSVRLSFKGVLAKHPSVVELTDSFNRMAAELEQTEMMRSDFINNFSHEFKTPIVSILGFARLLKRGNISDEYRNDCLNIIEEESLRLSQMATNVLNLSKVENQTILTDVANFNLTEQLRNCVLMLESKWSKKDIVFSLPEEEYYITANEEMMKQVWINIIDNAIKFSEASGTVEIEIKKEAVAISTAISNYGTEIPEESRKKVFEKFYQSDESHSSEGNGVGLAVVKRIVELHKGTVGVSCKDGKTTFTVSVPA